MIRKIKKLINQPKPFRHSSALKYESKSAAETILKAFPQVYQDWETAKLEESLWQSADDQWFSGDQSLWNEFVTYIKERKCLEIGSGPFGYLAPCYWIENRTIIDPLIDCYRSLQLKKFNKTFFTDNIKTYNINAEQFVNDLKGSIDGFIVSRNCLDHCEDPLTILNNISEYAAPGSFLLLWTDLWHIDGCDEGHTNITKSSAAMDKLLNGMGFEILQRGETIRNPSEFIEYGVLARKR